MDEIFNNPEYFNNEHSKFKEEMLQLGWVQDGCFWVKQDDIQERIEVIEHYFSTI